MSQHKGASIIRLSLTFDLYYAFNCSVLVFHVVACWVLMPSLFHPTPYPFLRNPLDRSVFEKSVATTEMTTGKTRALQESNLFPRTALVTKAPNLEARDLTNVERTSTGTAEKEESALPSADHEGEQLSTSTSSASTSFAHRPTDGYHFQLSRCFLYVTVASTIVTSFEVARCLVARVRHRRKIKNDLDGWPQGHTGLALLFGAFLPEVLTLVGLAVDDLSVSAILALTSSQGSAGDCDRDISGSGSGGPAPSFPVALASTVVSSSWKLCVVVVKVVRRHRHGNVSRVGAAFLFLVRSFCFLLAVLSLVVSSANLLVLFGPSDVITTNPVLATFFRSTRGKYRYLDDSWISMVMHRIPHPPTQHNFSDVSSVDVITAPLIRWKELLVRSPEKNRTVVPVPCAVLGNWYLPFVQESDSACAGCTLFFSFRYLGGKEVGYSAWYCVVRNCGTRAGTRISRSFGMEQFVWLDSWNFTEFSNSWKDRSGGYGTFPPSSWVNSTSDPGTFLVQALVFGLVSSIPVSSECQYFLTHFDNSEPRFC